MGPCEIAPGAIGGNGYGRATYEGRQQLAHRVAWQKVNGPIPSDMEVMHLCDEPRCVRLSHLQLGTHAENMADMKAKGRQRRPFVETQTHCKHGHEFDEANTIWTWSSRLGRKVRSCRACRTATNWGRKRRDRSG